MNWRKPLARGVFSVIRPSVTEYVNEFDRIEELSTSDCRAVQRDRLAALLQHAHDTVPYYRDVLSDSGVIDGGNVHLQRFSEVPLLTKDDLRDEKNRLRSTEAGSGVYANTSGGTTGEPVEFLQDEDHLARGNATRIYFHRFAGRELGEPWIKLWGDESEILDERRGIKSRLSNFLLNRHVLNSYRMGEREMTEYVNRINDIRPKSIEAYVESINELAKHIERRNLSVHSPNGILTTAGTLTQSIRERVERVFDTTVLNKYGSREVGAVACECPRQEGMHIFDHTYYVEVVDEAGNPLEPGEEGELAITVLTNYTMPLVRYRIGDMGIGKAGQCACGRPFSMLEDVTGRVTDHFVGTDGDLVYPGYLRKLLYHRDWVEKYQIHQVSVDEVLFKIVLVDGSEPPEEDISEIRDKTKSILGHETSVEFDYPEHIDATDSGKYRYTLSDVA